MLRSDSKRSAIAALLLLCLGLLYFLAAGPWRAVRTENAFDFAPVYGAARNWLHGANPYDMPRVTAEVQRAGDDPARYPDAANLQPSIYPPTALPLAAAVAWLPWEPAKLLWACLLAASFAASLPLLYTKVRLSAAGKWLLAAAAFSFSPMVLGLSHGNPGILACSLTMLAVYFSLRGHGAYAALALGLAHCLKPQLSIAAVALFALWGYWRPLLLSFAVPVAAAIASILRAPSLSAYGQWLASLRQILSSALSPGGINDPSPANPYAYSIVNLQTLYSVWLHNPMVVNICTWLTASVLAGCFLRFRRELNGDRRLHDMAFFSALTLTFVYHRFYDEQLLLMAIPFLLAAIHKTNLAAALSLCLAVLWFPLNGLFRALPASLTPTAPLGFLLLRLQPLLILSMCFLLIPWTAGTALERVEPKEEPERAFGATA